MKFEALTYSAASFEGGASAPLRLGRSTCSAAALTAELDSSTPLSAAMLRFWVWVQMQFDALRAKSARQICSTPAHIFHVPSSEPEAPPRAVRVNRSMMRRLKRLQRLRPASHFDGPSMGDELRRLGLTLSQYREYLIRQKGYSRVRLHGLGLSRLARLWRAILGAALQGDAASLRLAMACHARLSPD